MTSRLAPRWFGALAALSLVVAACGGSADDASTTEAATSEVPASEASDPAVTSAVDDPSDAAGEGVTFTGATDDYTVVFPGEPVATPLPVELPTGQITAEAFIFEQGTQAAYFTSVFDYPPGLTDDDPQVVLTGARDGAVSNVGGTLRDSEFIDIDGVPGVGFTFDLPGGVGSAVVLFDDPRLYQTFALGEEALGADYQAFVDTFTFTGAGS